MKKLGLFFSIFLVASMMLAMVTLPVQANTFDQVIHGFKTTGDQVGYNTTDKGAPQREFVTAMAGYANGFMATMGALFMVLVIYGGWLWMSARGDEAQVARGKTLIVQAVIGISIIVVARIITELTIVYLGQVIGQRTP